MRKIMAALTAAILGLGVVGVAEAHAYQNEANGQAFAQPYAYNQGCFNLSQTQWRSTNGYCTWQQYGTNVRRGNDDVEYSFLIFPSPGYTDGAGHYISDRIYVRVLGPNSSMSVYSITDGGIAWR